jgi:carbonic anhydrase/acetyltransferase-like protein (isoleucine patch superfamily)
MKYDFLDGLGHVPASRHPNGGGLVADTATVDPTVFLSSDSCVYGFSVVRDNVRITGGASIQGDLLPGGISTLIENQVAIVGPVKIRNAVLLRNQAKVRGQVSLTGTVQIMHHATIAGNVALHGDVVVLDSAYISGNVRITATDEQYIIKGEEIIHGDVEILVTADSPGGRASTRSSRRIKNDESRLAAPLEDVSSA